MNSLAHLDIRRVKGTHVLKSLFIQDTFNHIR